MWYYRGHSIGLRLIDEFLAKSGISKFSDFKETAEIIAKVGFKMFLGVNASVGNWNVEGDSCSLVLEENPLNEFVEVPDEYVHKLWYSNILCGVIRGALEMVHMQVTCSFVKCPLRGDDTTELYLVLKEIMLEKAPEDD